MQYVYKKYTDIKCRAINMIDVAFNWSDLILILLTFACLGTLSGLLLFLKDRFTSKKSPLERLSQDGTKSSAAPHGAARRSCRNSSRDEPAARRTLISG